jgi:hypothetical protein
MSSSSVYSYDFSSGSGSQCSNYQCSGSQHSGSQYSSPQNSGLQHSGSQHSSALESARELDSFINGLQATEQPAANTEETKAHFHGDFRCSSRYTTGGDRIEPYFEPGSSASINRNSTSSNSSASRKPKTNPSKSSRSKSKESKLTSFAEHLLGGSTHPKGGKVVRRRLN